MKKTFLTAVAAVALALSASAVAVADATVRVDASAGWTDSGVAVEQGEAVSLSTVGRAFTTRPWRIGDTYFPPNRGSGRAGESGPAGQPYTCTSWAAGTCLVENAPYGALVGRIGTTTFSIGDATSLVAPASGELELAVNDAAEWLFDNSGGFTAAVGG